MIAFLNKWLGIGIEKIWLGLGAIAAALAILGRAKRKGVLEERERQIQQQRKEREEAERQRVAAVKKLEKKREEIAHMPDDDVARRLRDNWTRNGDR